ncbi:MAG: hypoxanthine phosphoribosyltransferase [Opitutales bacterium]|nr:hypoxanthine phosphoribosyltransferase [Opitutales bacterium]MCH8540945.1 hypoxanthine phosphoribosyltransferase [Opitutales bacterium]
MSPKKPTPSPLPEYPDLEEILVTGEQIAKRIREIGAEIAEAYEDEEITVISIINGALLFTADLIRQIDNPVRVDCIRVSSYRNSTTSEKEPEILYNINLDLENRHVLLIDDILDTGKTLFMLTEAIQRMGPKSLRTCVLLNKIGRREISIDADFVGFDIPDRFVVGYGLDFAERYRNLPCIGVLHPSRQNPMEWA